MSTDIERIFQCVTTPLKSIKNNEESKSSGFFYYTNNFNVKGNKEFWLITNRHVLLDDIHDNKSIFDSIIFYLKKHTGFNDISWNEIFLDKHYLINHSKFHRISNIDIGIVKLNDIMKKNSYDLDIEPYKFPFHAVSRNLISQNNNIRIEAGDDLITVGYPHGFYDEKNLFPVLRSSILSSKWGSFFNGDECFLIDRRLYPGSSGSLVISKPSNMTIENEQIVPHKTKQFSFLGIYSEERYSKDKTQTDSGIVWYSYLVEDIINNGLSLG